MIISRFNSFLSAFSGRYLEKSAMAMLSQNFKNKYGYLRSKQMKLPVDSLGQPVPWFTYPAIEFLDSLDLSRSTIFEWGSGHSSIYFSKKCSRIESIESDPKWYQYQSARLASNQTLRLISSRSCEYSEAICSSETPCFELIIIDGHQRSLCVKQAIHKLAKGGC